MKIKVTITGREVTPVAKLLDGLTRTGLLDGRATWEETGDSVVLNIEGTQEDVRVFQSFNGYHVAAL